jgi:hypothetical protein
MYYTTFPEFTDMVFKLINFYRQGLITGRQLQCLIMSFEYSKDALGNNFDEKYMELFNDLIYDLEYYRAYGMGNHWHAEDKLNQVLERFEKDTEKFSRDSLAEEYNSDIS